MESVGLAIGGDGSMCIVGRALLRLARFITPCSYPQ
jgi:hypothetical protein